MKLKRLRKLQEIETYFYSIRKTVIQSAVRNTIIRRYIRIYILNANTIQIRLKNEFKTIRQ